MMGVSRSRSSLARAARAAMEPSRPLLISRSSMDTSELILCDRQCFEPSACAKERAPMRVDGHRQLCQSPTLKVRRRRSHPRHERRSPSIYRRDRRVVNRFRSIDIRQNGEPPTSNVLKDPADLLHKRRNAILASGMVEMSALSSIVAIADDIE